MPACIGVPVLVALVKGEIKAMFKYVDLVNINNLLTNIYIKNNVINKLFALLIYVMIFQWNPQRIMSEQNS